MSRLLVTGITLGLLTACGQSGPLYLPQPAVIVTEQQPSDATPVIADEEPSEQGSEIEPKQKPDSTP